MSELRHVELIDNEDGSILKIYFKFRKPPFTIALTKDDDAHRLGLRLLSLAADILRELTRAVG